MKTPFVTRARSAARRLLALAGLALLSGLAASPLAAQGTGRITGTVTSAADGSPVADATVTVQGTALTARTGPDGRYTLSGVPAGTQQVRAGQLGFASASTSVAVAAGQTATANFSLGAQILLLDSVVAVGYTTQNRRTVSDAVSSVSAEDIDDRQVATVEQALAGRVPGVSVVSSGEPGRASNVVIRGQNFLSATDPLYVVDGMYTRQNPNLNPDDIESIQVLKDASAAAQYGAQSANGVIVIRTRRGAAGAPRVSVNSYYGWQDVPTRIEMVSAQRWNEINLAAREASLATDDNLTAADYTVTSTTDWQDAVFRSGAMQNHNVQVAGGSETASYLLGFGYFDQEGTILGTGFERYSFRVNSEIRRGALTLGQNAALSRSRRENIIGFPLIDAVRLIPAIPVYDPSNDSGYGYGFGEDAYETYGTNPVGVLEDQTSTDYQNRVLGNAYGQLALGRGLSFRLNLGVDYQDLNWLNFVGLGQLRQGPPNDFNYGTDRRDNITSFLVENLLSYEGSRGDHAINAVAGVTQQWSRFERVQAYARGFLDEDIREISAGTFGFENEGFENPSALQGYLLRANYSFADRYLLTGTVRRDGSSRFGPGNRWANFASASAGWVISEEDFFGGIPLLGGADYLKLRASYGSLGNQDIGDFEYTATIVGNESYILGDRVVTGSTQVALANPFIRWQDQTQTNIGLDLNLLGNALELTADYYVSESDGLLVSAPIPPSSGGGDPPTVNAGRIRNRGFELGARMRRGMGPVDVSLGANLTTIDNEVLELGNGGQPIFRAVGSDEIARTQVGGSVGEFYVLQTDGIFRSQAEIDAHTTTLENGTVVKVQPNAKPGDVRYVDINRDGVINAEGDRYVAGSPIPDFEGGLNLEATYYGFNFGLALRGSYGAEVFNVVRFWTDRLDETGNYRADLDPWSPTNPNGRDPRAVFGGEGADNARLISDRWVEDGSYLRVQNIVLGYQIPDSFASRFGVGLQGTRVYLNVQNAHTFTGFSNWDPEVRGGDDPLLRGVDDGRIYPNPRTFTLGVDVNL